jgi:hypothetical protein
MAFIEILVNEPAARPFVGPQSNGWAADEFGYVRRNADDNDL